MNFFINCQTVQEIKSLFRELAFKYHPDHGGDEETMKQLNNEYQAALKGCNGQKSYSKDEKGQEREHTYKYDESLEQETIDFINKFLELNLELQADIIGSWVWITGDTKPHKEALKELGCRWHSARMCWYYRPESQKGYRGSGGSLEELASKYGCQNVDKFKKKGKKIKAA